MDEIYQKYSRLVYNYLFCLTGNAELSEDLMQETFYSAIKNIDKFNYKCKISVWLCQIAKNKYKNELRKRNNTISLEKYPFEALEIDETFIENIESDIILEEEKEHLYKIIQQLDEPIRELFYLRIKSNFTFKEIAGILGRTEEWVRVNFYRTKIKIKEELENDK